MMILSFKPTWNTTKFILSEFSNQAHLIGIVILLMIALEVLSLCIHSLKCLPHMLVKYEQNCIVQTNRILIFLTIFLK